MGPKEFIFNKLWVIDRKIMINKNAMKKSMDSGIAFTGDITGEALEIHANALESFIQNKSRLTVSTGHFDIADPDVAQFVETFGPAMYTYSQKDFAIFLNNYQNQLTAKFKRDEGLANQYFNLRESARVSGTSSPSDLNNPTDELLNIDGGVIGDTNLWGTRYEEYRSSAANYNEQNNDLFGEYISTIDRFRTEHDPGVKTNIVNTFLNQQKGKTT